jgi:hypothetical protein
MLWVITSYFNPAGYRTRKRNYARFRKHLGVPLLAVELASDGRLELDSGDADRLIQIHDGHVLWQKERLLNIALSHLPENCTAVAWVDADVLFDNPQWPELTLRALERNHFVQPFEDLLELDQHQNPEEHGDLPAQRCSFASALALGTLPPDYLTSSGKSNKYGLSPGHAWASRRSILEQSGFYDAMIVGGGDRAMINAMCGEIEGYIDRCILTPAHAEHYRKWAAGFYRLAQSKIGYVPGRLTHLWHGTVQNRNYMGRQAILAESDFDPARDIECQTQQVWRWAHAGKTRLHRSIADYFRDRREDG